MLHRVQGGQLERVRKRIASYLGLRPSSLAGSLAGSLASHLSAQVLGFHGGALCSKALQFERFIVELLERSAQSLDCRDVRYFVLIWQSVWTRPLLEKHKWLPDMQSLARLHRP